MVVTARPVRFDGQAPGTSEDAWVAAGLPDRATDLRLAGVRRLLVVSAHPDDETLGAAGLIARLHAHGATIEVLVASDGEASHPHRPGSAEWIGPRRRREMESATDHLAPGTAIQWLGGPDGRLADHEGRLAAAVGGVLGSDTASTLVVAPWRVDGHPDHEAVARAVTRATAGSGAAVLEFPVWAWLWARPDDPRLRPENLRVLRLTEGEWRGKQRAIAEHRSQIAPLPDDPEGSPVLTPTFLEHFRRSYEIFLPPDGGVA